MDFLREIAVSLIGSTVFIAVAWVFSKTARKVLRSVVANLLKLDVEEVFQNSREASEDIRSELDRAHDIVILTSRGSELQRAPYENLLQDCLAGKKTFKVLLPQLTTPSGSTDWVEDRERETSTFDVAFGSGLLRRQIQENRDFLISYATSGHLEVRGYNFPHIGRILATERVVYLTPYSKNRHGRDSTIIKYRRGETYDFLMRIIEKLWADDHPAGT